MFEKILFATSASPTCDDAAKVAFELSKKNRSKLSVMHVFGIPTRAFSPFVKDLHTGKEEMVSDEYVSQVIEEMRSTYADFLKDQPDCDLLAMVGEPGTEILRTARKRGADLIVMGAHTRGDEIGATRHRAIAGSTMQRVARTARCPVLIVSRPCITCWSYFANIVVGTDFSKAADNAFAFALNVARDIGCRLHVFHALDLAGEAEGKSLDQTEVEARLAKARKKMEDRYVAKMGDFDNYLIEIWEGSPYVEILKYARESKADLIVLSHHTREVDPEQALLGSTVEQVVLRSACPVLSVNQPDKVDVSPYGYRPDHLAEE
jgi:nucleotide-binding universal stress UspA family protein